MSVNGDDVGDTNGASFRLKQCSDWLSYLERELEARENFSKKYKRARSILVNISTGTGSMSLVLSGGGLGTGITGIGISVAITLGAVGSVCALVSVITGV